MYLMIDNYDSFVYNLKAYLDELNEDVKVVRNDKITIDEISQMNNLKGIIISPGPKSPKDSGICRDVVRKFSNKIPILGVCLGHQIIGYEYGAVVEKVDVFLKRNVEKEAVLRHIALEILKVHI